MQIYPSGISALLKEHKMNFPKQKTTRIYLHFYKSRRIVMLMRDFKIANLELDLSKKRHYSLKGASLALLGSDDEQLPWRESVFDKPHGGYPFYTLRTKDVCGADVSFEVFASADENPVTYFKITVSNHTESPVSGSLALQPCTSDDDRYLTGLWDTGYAPYDPNIRAQYMLDSHYEKDERADTLAAIDGYAGARVNMRSGLYFDGKNEHFFKPSGIIRYKYVLAPNESAELTGAFSLAEVLPEKIDFDGEKSKAKAAWDEIFGKVKLYPSTEKKDLRDIYMAQITNCLQMIQTYADGTVFPRQGCVGRFVWAWEAAYFLTALDRIGLSEYTTEAHRTLLEKWMVTDESSPDYGKIANPFVNWANTNGSVIWCVSEHLKATKDRKKYEEFMPYLKMAVQWIENKRNADPKPGDAPKMFPSAVASDWSEVGQHYTYTDSVNIMGYRSLVEVCEIFGDGDTEKIRAVYDDYYGALQDVIKSLEEGHDESEDYMPTHILGKNFWEVRTHCYTTDGVVYLPMCGNLDPNGKLFGFVERFYARHGLMDNGLTARMTNLDFGAPGVYGDCYYTNVSEICWMYAYLMKGERDKAEKMLESIYKFNLSDEYATSERYTPLNVWYAPWQPNASASGRIISAMLDFYGETSN